LSSLPASLSSSNNFEIGSTYPLEFHRRSEQKWMPRVQASSA
jgi:hypothetical protein